MLQKTAQYLQRVDNSRLCRRQHPREQGEMLTQRGRGLDSLSLYSLPPHCTAPVHALVDEVDNNK